MASGAVAIANDGSTETEAVASTIGCGPAAEEAAPPAALSTEELRDLAEKAQAVAELRVQQAAAQGVPVRLADLLVDDSWREALGPEFIKPYMSQLQTFLAEEWAKQQIYPPQPFIFRCASCCTILSSVTSHAWWALSCSCNIMQGLQQLPTRPGQSRHHRTGVHGRACHMATLHAPSMHKASAGSWAR